MVLPNILVVDGDPALRCELAELLAEHAQVTCCGSGAEALRAAREQAPALLVLDAELPDMSGFALFGALQQSAGLQHVPVIFLTTDDSAEQEIAGLALGAADFVSKPLRPHLLRARVAMQLRMCKLTEALQDTRAVDPLTGLLSREHFLQELDLECARASRSGSPTSLLVISLDPERRYMATHGSHLEQHALRLLASVMRGTLQRASDQLARYQDSEFAAILPDTDGVGAMLVAHNVIAAIDAQGVPYQRAPIAGHVTASVGVTVYAAETSRHSALNVRELSSRSASHVAHDMLSAAGRAVISAKRAGGHCVCFVAVEGVAKPAPAQLHTAGLDGE